MGASLELPGAPGGGDEQPGGDGGWAEVILSIVTIVFFTGYSAYNRYKKSNGVSKNRSKVTKELV